MWIQQTGSDSKSKNESRSSDTSSLTINFQFIVKKTTMGSFIIISFTDTSLLQNLVLSSDQIQKDDVWLNITSTSFSSRLNITRTPFSSSQESFPHYGDYVCYYCFEDCFTAVVTLQMAGAAPVLNKGDGKNPSILVFVVLAS